MSEQVISELSELVAALEKQHHQGLPGEPGYCSCGQWRTDCIVLGRLTTTRDVLMFEGHHMYPDYPRVCKHLVDLVRLAGRAHCQSDGGLMCECGKHIRDCQVWLAMMHLRHAAQEVRDG